MDMLNVKHGTVFMRSI